VYRLFRLKRQSENRYARTGKVDVLFEQREEQLRLPVVHVDGGLQQLRVVLHLAIGVNQI
jgi:hypothetical protein